jgi:hypothetical protein
MQLLSGTIDFYVRHDNPNFLLISPFAEIDKYVNETPLIIFYSKWYPFGILA